MSHTGHGDPSPLIAGETEAHLGSWFVWDGSTLLATLVKGPKSSDTKFSVSSLGGGDCAKELRRILITPLMQMGSCDENIT